jgi:hypothetical protein
MVTRGLGIVRIGMIVPVELKPRIHMLIREMLTMVIDARYFKR